MFVVLYNQTSQKENGIRVINSIMGKDTACILYFKKRDDSFMTFRQNVGKSKNHKIKASTVVCTQKTEYLIF